LSEPSTPQNTPTAVWDRRFLFLVLAVFLWKLLYLAIAPLDLAPDEAYYWDWSRRLDWCYYSKPPMVAWVMALSTNLLGSTVQAVRLPGLFFWLIATCCLYGLGRRLFGGKAAFWAALTAVTIPLSCAYGIVMTIDPPLVGFWALALYTLWYALEKVPGSAAAWLITALWVGLGLLSKQIMLVFLPLVFLFLILNPGDRPQLRRLRPYAFVVIALAFLVPALWWNSRHEWITFQHSSHHFEGVEKSIPLSPRTFLEFLGSQLALVSPVNAGLFFVISAAFLRHWKRQKRAVRYLLIFGAVPLLAILLLSLRQRVQGNWPAAFYLAGALLLAAWGIGEISCKCAVDRLRFLYKPGIAVGAVLTVLTYLMPFYLPVSPLGGGPKDPTTRVRGWGELGQRVGAFLEASPNREKTFVLATTRQLTSELAFYLPGQPRVYHWPGKKWTVRSQYELWEGPAQNTGWDCLVVTEAGRKLPTRIRRGFRSVEPRNVVRVALGRAGDREVNVYQCRELLEWPARQ
jgi:undecaprenyl-diphosphatase